MSKYIQIWYSWGDQEAPVEVPEGKDAFAYAIELSTAEAKEYMCTGHNGVSIESYSDEEKIVLNYYDDNEKCYYMVTDEGEFDPFNE